MKREIELGCDCTDYEITATNEGVTVECGCDDHSTADDRGESGQISTDKLLEVFVACLAERAYVRQDRQGSSRCKHTDLGFPEKKTGTRRNAIDGGAVYAERLDLTGENLKALVECDEFVVVKPYGSEVKIFLRYDEVEEAIGYEKRLEHLDCVPDSWIREVVEEHQRDLVYERDSPYEKTEIVKNPERVEDFDEDYMPASWAGMSARAEEIREKYRDG